MPYAAALSPRTSLRVRSTEDEDSPERATAVRSLRRKAGQAAKKGAKHRGRARREEAAQSEARDAKAARTELDSQSETKDAPTRAEKADGSL